MTNILITVSIMIVIGAFPILMLINFEREDKKRYMDWYNKYGKESVVPYEERVFVKDARYGDRDFNIIQFGMSNRDWIDVAFPKYMDVRKPIRILKRKSDDKIFVDRSFSRLEVYVPNEDKYFLCKDWSVDLNNKEYKYKIIHKGTSLAWILKTFNGKIIK